MPKYTPNLNIQLADPATDGNQTFNIDTMINNPLEKLDAALGLVPVSGDVRAATTGNIVLSGAQTIDGIALSAGNRVLVKNQTAGKENGIYTVASGAWIRAVDANSTAKLAAGISVYVEEGAANGKSQWQMTNTGTVTLDSTAITFEKTGGAASATDTVIGSRTVSDTTAPTGDSGSVTTLFGWLASMIKAITGGATWRTLPGMSIAAIKTVLDAATNLGTASTLMKRDAAGRTQVAAPSAAGDVARKDTVDGAITAHRAEADPHTGYVKKSGDTMTGPFIAPGVAAVKDGDAIVTIEDTGAVATSFRIKQLFSSRNVNNGNGWLFRSVRPTDMKITDVQLQGPEGIPTIISLSTYSDLAFYVRADGDNTNPGTANTAAGAFRTLNRALSLIPRTVNHTVIIYILEGQTHEAISLSGYVGCGSIAIRSTSDTVRATVPYVRISDCTCPVSIQNLNISYDTDVAVGVYRCPGVTLGNLSVTGAHATAGVYADRSKLVVYNGVISNRGYAFYADVLSEVWVDSVTGTGNTTAYTAIRGSRIVVYWGTTISATAEQTVGSGGTVQRREGVINPWGDNTAWQRPYVFAYTDNANLIVQGNQSTKVPLNKKAIDNLSNYDTTLHRFNIPASGIYSVSGYVHFISPGVGNGLSVKIYHNGNPSVNLGMVGIGTSINTTVGGTTEMYLVAGDYIELYVLCYSNSLIYSDMSHTYLKVTRIA
jgi:hypothetical protein